MQPAPPVHPTRQASPHIVAPMNAAIRTTKPGKVSASTAKAVAAPRISKKIRLAIDYIAIDAMPARRAAQRAGIHEVTLYKALAKPHIAAALDERKAQLTLECEKLKGIARNLAIQTGIELMQTSASDNVRARMVEFFAGEARQASVNVQINNAPAQGYAYRRPDQASEAIDGQAVEVKGPTPSVD